MTLNILDTGKHINTQNTLIQNNKKYVSVITHFQ